MLRRYFCFGLLSVVVLAASAVAFAVTHPNPQASEEFHQTYQISENGRITLENISGAVDIKGWNRNEVRVDAIKKANREERLGDAEILVDADSSSVRIKTKYRSDSLTWNDGWKRDNNPPSVDYTLMVPFNIKIDKVSVVNSSVEIGDLSGAVNVSSVNGQIKASKLSGAITLSTVNGELETSFDQLSDSQHVRLSSVNGAVVLTISNGANAEVNANTVHGGISNDFGWEVTRGQYVGRYMSGMLGSGTTRITLGNVNGSITVRKGSNGPLIPPMSRLSSLKGKLGDERSFITAEDRRSTDDREFLDKKRGTLENGRAMLDRKRASIDKQRNTLDRQIASVDQTREDLARRRYATVEERRVLDAERAVLDAERTALESVRAMLDKQRSAFDDDLNVIKAQLSGIDQNFYAVDTKSNKTNKTKGR